jgi:hypothetical protein
MFSAMSGLLVSLLLSWALVGWSAHGSMRGHGDAVLQRLTALGMDLVNLISNQRHKLAMMGKMGVDKAWELMAKIILSFGQTSTRSMCLLP